MNIIVTLVVILIGLLLLREILNVFPPPEPFKKIIYLVIALVVFLTVLQMLGIYTLPYGRL